MRSLALLFVSSWLLGLDPGAALSRGWPPGVPDGPALGWEQIDGEVETTASTLVYRFYVNPARPAIYELARYHFVRLEAGVRKVDSEKVVWNAYPTGGKGPQCYALETGTWRTLERGSPEYRNEMGMAMYVYGVHRRTSQP